MAKSSDTNAHRIAAINSQLSVIFMALEMVKTQALPPQEVEALLDMALDAAQQIAETTGQFP